MANSSSSSSSGGIGFVGLLTIVFITLKLLDKIQWSWLWVLSPIWISTGLIIGGLLIALIVWGILQLFKQKRRSRRAGVHRSR
jgi:hypothetical protein